MQQSNGTHFLAMVYGAMVIVLIGAYWAYSGLIAFSGVSVPAAQLVSGVAAAALLALLIRLARTLRRAPAKPDEHAPAQRRRALRGLLLVDGIQVIAIIIVSNLLMRNGADAYILVAIVVIVGLHFFPLARLFHVPRYNLTGLALCLLALLTPLLLPAVVTSGATTVQVWSATIGLGGAAILWATALAMRGEVARVYRASVR